MIGWTRRVEAARDRSSDLHKVDLKSPDGGTKVETEGLVVDGGILGEGMQSVGEGCCEEIQESSHSEGSKRALVDGWVDSEWEGDER